MTQRIDWQLIRRRRLELGLTSGATARITGYSEATFSECESGRATGGGITVARLGRLVDRLALRLSDVFVIEPGPPAPDIIVRKLGAALLVAERPRSVMLASALGVSLDELHAAGDELEDRLDACGLRLLRQPIWQLSTDPRALPHTSERKLAAAQRTRYGLTRPAAHVLYRILTGRLAAQSNNSTSLTDRLQLAHLLRHGLIEAAPDNTYVLHPDVASSLGLPHLAGPQRTRGAD